MVTIKIILHKILYTDFVKQKWLLKPILIKNILQKYL